MYIESKLKKLNFSSKTNVQSYFFEKFKTKENIVCIAPTGTGKTHAYLLPIFESINKAKNEIQAVIIVPTNELCGQVYDMASEIDDEINIKAYFGKTDKAKDLKTLSIKMPQVVIATPAKILEYAITENVLKIHTAKWVVFDEADMMFDEDFLSMIDQFIKAINNARFFLFSATISLNMKSFIKDYFGPHITIDTRKETILKIKYLLINIKNQDRLESLFKLTEVINPFCALVFVSKKENQNIVYEKLLETNSSVVTLNSSLNVKQRKRILSDIKEHKYQYVVTSDLMARGIDFKVSHVIHYDLPSKLEFYFHRSGRTGRMNEAGEVITFMSVDDHRKIDSLRKKGIEFIEYSLTKDGLIKKRVKERTLSKEEVEVIKKIKKPTKVKPNYKKKNKEKIQKAKRELRRKQYAKNR